MKYEIFKSDEKQYGIRAKENEKVLGEIKNITVSEEKAQEMAYLFNKHSLSIIHFKEAVEDFLVK